MEKRPIKRPTIAEVAEDANVSIATVSRVITGSGVVSEERARRVRDSIRKLGYRPSRAARELSSHRAAQKVGMIMGAIATPFLMAVLSGVQTALLKEDYVLLVGETMHNPKLEQRHYDLMREEGVSGFIFRFQPNKRGASPLMYNSSVPVVAVDYLPEGGLLFDSVTVHNRIATKKATNHLIKLGHRNIGFMSGGQVTWTAKKRTQGFIEALQEAEIPFEKSQIQGDDFTFESGYEAMRALCSLPTPPTAVLASNYDTTLGAIQYISDHGLKIPDDIAIVGFDDTPWMSAFNPPLTVVDQHPVHIGMTAAELLLARIKDPQRPLQQVVLEADLIVRKSCGANA